MEQIKFVWNMMYRVWPPCIRTAERLGFHNFRQKYLLGHLNANYNKENLEKALQGNGFESAIIAWRDPGEVLSMRKIHNNIFQYHIRLFIDGEIRAHYEYSPESHPLDHFFEARFDPETEFFVKILGDHLIVGGKKKDRYLRFDEIALVS
ncbi:MAG: hypothetical protein Q7R65_04765 [bacterium]|nr:hypothetical protein [bacterium]